MSHLRSRSVDHVEPSAESPNPQVPPPVFMEGPNIVVAQAVGRVREMPIVPDMLGMRIKVYNGKEYQDLLITPELLGHRLGEYSHTTKMVKHSGPGIGATRGSKSVDLK